MNSVFVALPQFEITQVEKSGSTIKYSGRVKNTVSFAKARPGWVVCIHVSQNKFIEGKFSNINSHTFQVVIDVSDMNSQTSLVIGEDYPLLDGYWGILAEIVLDEATVWNKIRLESRDMTVHHSGGNVKVVKNVWDHEHCRICFQRISVLEADNQFGYANQQGDWLCESCYQKYVIEKSLGFINLGQMF